jgi:hypothetical protein
MRKAVWALTLAFLLGVGLAAQGEGETKRVTGCIKRVFFNLGTTPGRAFMAVVVGDGVFYFHQDGMEYGRTASLSYSEVAAFEPFLASIRAGAQARVQAFVDWDEATKRVMYFEILFDRPCQ